MKPMTIAPNYEALPAELRGMPIWLLWDYKLVDGRWTKVPLVADLSHRRARSNDHRTWRPFDEALTLVNTVSGLGMCITGEYCGFDLDCCRDKETGVVAPWAQRIVSLLKSYTEVSPSGEGLHVIVKLKRELPTGRRMRGGKERCGWEIALFDKTSPRYFAMTGSIVEAHDSIRLCDPREFFPQFEMGGLDPEPVKTNGKAADSSEQKLNKRARLIKGEWEGIYPSQSEADAALTWFFALDYDDDAALIDRAFRSSGMMRPKWDEPRPGGTYGSLTIARCLDERHRAQKTRRFILNDEGKIKPLSADRDQIWAEAYRRYLDGAVWWLDTKELNEAASLEQEERYDAGVWDEVILAWLEDPKQRHETDGGSQLPIKPFDSSVGRVTVTDVLVHAVGKDVARCTQSDRNQVQRCLIHAGWKRKQVRVGPRRLWFYEQTEAGVVNAHNVVVSDEEVPF